MSSFFNQLEIASKVDLVKVHSTAILIALFCLASILPFVLISIYIHPSADDYNFFVKTDTLGYIGAQINWYTTWTGRYFSSAIISLPIFLKSSNFTVYKLVPIFLIAGYLYSFHLLIKTLLKDISSKNSAIISAFFLTLIFAQSPSIAEAFYFLSASITYTLPNILLLLFLAVLVKALTRKNIKYQIAAVVLPTFIVGSNETIMVLLTLILSSIIVLKYLKEKSISSFTVIIFSITIIFSLVVFFSPGNAIRGMNFPEKHQFLYSVKKSLVAMRGYIGLWLPSLMIFGVILGGFLKKLDVKTHLLNIHPILILVITLFSVFTCFFIGYWSVGSLIPDRTINTIYFIFLLGITFSVISFVSNTTLTSYIRSTSFISAVLIIFLAHSQIKSGNIQMVYTDIFDKSAKNYNLELEQRYAHIRNCSSQKCSFPELQNTPPSIHAYDITSDPNHWRNISYAQYFFKKEVTIK